MALYQSYNPSWWKGRIDGDDSNHLRWHQSVRGFDFEKRDQQGFAILGFSSDTGVKRNMGRPGAVNGPQYVQRALCNLPVHRPFDLYDAGNVLCDTDDLEAAQKLLGSKVSAISKNGTIPIILGGGHETSWGHFQGIVQADPDSHIGIINFDAHFDLRKSDVSTSGSPFYQIAKFQQARNGAFRYMVLGVQKHANTKALFKRADDLHVAYHWDTDFYAGNHENLLQSVVNFCSSVDRVMLSIDMDVFHASYAPGVSAVNASGIIPDTVVFGLLRAICGSGKLGSVDLVEVNPNYDVDGRTGKLAARLIFELLENWSGS